MLIKMIREEPDKNGNTTKYVGESSVKTAEEEGWKRADGKTSEVKVTKKTKKIL